VDDVYASPCICALLVCVCVCVCVRARACLSAGSTDADQRVWGSLHQTAQTFEILLNIVPGVVLARVGTAALRLTGYQVRVPISKP
jgi:hypothetical protein